MNDIPIILVHGYHGSPSVMDFLERNFLNNHYNKTYNFSYEDTTEEEIHTNANRLWLYLNEKRLSDGKVILVGHSMGGLVVRKMAADHPNLDVVKLITLATPNYGARYANLCPGPIGGHCTQAVNDMAPGSSFLRNLNNKTIHTYSEDKVLTYVIQKDELVSFNSGIIESALCLFVNNNASLDGNTEIHSSIVEKKEVFANILKFITGKLRVIDYGPKLRDADCAYLFWDNSTIRWDIPSGSSSTLKMHVYDKRNLKYASEPAQRQIKEKMSKGEIKFRFYDQESGILSKWSYVVFSNQFFKCRSYIRNYKNVLVTWQK